MLIKFLKTDDSTVWIATSQIVAMSENRGTTQIHTVGFNFHVQGTIDENLAKWELALNPELLGATKKPQTK